jgi:hypothetical protein
MLAAPGQTAGVALLQETRSIPIVFVLGGDPVLEGLVANIAHPASGGEMGLSNVRSGSHVAACPSHDFPRTARSMKGACRDLAHLIVKPKDRGGGSPLQVRSLAKLPRDLRARCRVSELRPAAPGASSDPTERDGCALPQLFFVEDEKTVPAFCHLLVLRQLGGTYVQRC